MFDFLKKDKKPMDKIATLRDIKLIYDLLIVIAKKSGLDAKELAVLLINDKTKKDFINELTKEVVRLEQIKYGEIPEVKPVK